MINSTAISAQLPSTPFLTPLDQWKYVQNHEVLYHRKGVEETPQKITVNGALPKTVTATGLKKYTEYVFYAHYFGTISSKDQNIITTYSAPVRTDEDGIYLIFMLVIFNATTFSGISCSFSQLYIIAINFKMFDAIYIEFENVN